MDLLTFGAREDADRATMVVRSVHSRVRGQLRQPAGCFPAGTPWAADDPELLLWILATPADSAALLYQACVSRLGAAHLDAFWKDYRTVGHLFGLTDPGMPGDWAGVREYVTRTIDRDVLHVSPEARELGRRVVLHPPTVPWFRPVLEIANFVIVGWLPARLRRQYHLFWHPGRSLALTLGAESSRRALVPLLPARLRRRADDPLKSQPPPFSRPPGDFPSSRPRERRSE